MNPQIKETLLSNRVKLMKLCDYYIVSSPLIAKRILPIEKHKIIKASASGITDIKAANNARMDALLEFLDECVVPGAFDAFVEGVRNCEGQKSFAKTLKKDAEGKGGSGAGGSKPNRAPAAKKPKTTTGTTNISTSIKKEPTVAGLGNVVLVNGPQHLVTGITGVSVGGGGSPPRINIGSSVGSGGSGTSPVRILSKKPISRTTPFVPGFAYFSTVPGPSLKAPAIQMVSVPRMKIEANPPEGGIRAAGGGLGGAPPPLALPTRVVQISPKPEPGVRPAVAAPAQPTPEPPPGLAAILASISRGGLPAKQPSSISATKPLPSSSNVPSSYSGGAATSTAIKIQPAPSAPGAPPVIPSPALAPSNSVFIARIPQGSPFKPRQAPIKRAAATAAAGSSSSASGPPKAKPMTFQDVEAKQRSSSRATTFQFTSPAAVVKTIHFNNKSDLFYEGCPTMVGGSWCAKKVQLKGKGKKYVCKERHENESYNLFPRLYVTFEDGTTHIQTVLYRENVEILAGKTITEMQAMNEHELKVSFFRTLKKNIPIEVKCKKIAQKDLKTADGATWDNIATIVIEPPIKTEGTSTNAAASKRARKSIDG